MNGGGWLASTGDGIDFGFEAVRRRDTGRSKDRSSVTLLGSPREAADRLHLVLTTGSEYSTDGAVSGGNIELLQC